MMENVERQLYRQFKATSERYRLLEPNDRILVAVSGGKDSYTLLVLLEALRSRLPFAIDLVAVHLDQRQPDYDGTPLVRFLEQTKIPFEILSEDTYAVVKEHVDQGGTYCALCSRLRRGILYSAAERLGCNKIALGHHRDDSLETFLMNLFYGGKLQAMPSRYTTDDGRFEVIRPLLECAEERIAAFASARAFPILPCNLCGSQPGLKRDRMTALLRDLERGHPNLKSVMMAALGNVSPSHLLDQDLAELWRSRPAHMRPNPTVKVGRHHGALPVLQGGLNHQPFFTKNQSRPKRPAPINRINSAPGTK